MISNVRHVALFVSDIEIGIRLYEKLGADLKSQDLERGTFIETLLGLPNIIIQTCKLHFSDSSRLELICFNSTSRVPPLTPPDSLKEYGINPIKFDPTSSHLSKNLRLNNNINHIAFTVENIDESINIIQSFGGQLYSGPVINPPEHSEFAVRAKHAYIFDPFGNLLHLAQELMES